MKFGSNDQLERRVGRICLVYAAVEHAAGHVVQAADGDWALAGSTAYLTYSSGSGVLLDWLKDVGKAYPEVAAEATTLRDDLRALKDQRDEWAHSAAVGDLWLMMMEQGQTVLDLNTTRLPDKMLNSKKAGHFDPPTDSDVEAFVARASDIGDAAEKLGRNLAALVDDKGIRPVRSPKP